MRQAAKTLACSTYLEAVVIDSQTPLTPALFNVLLALADGDKHGYAILKEVAEQTDGEVQLSTWTLYGIIKRLLSEGLIVEVRRRPPLENDDQRRRYYRLTTQGREHLRQLHQHWNELSSAVDTLLADGKPEKRDE